jgi:Zn-dependent metalloprotease
LNFKTKIFKTIKKLLFLLTLIIYGGRGFSQKYQPKYLREDNKEFKAITSRTTDNGWITFKKEAKLNPNTFFKDYATSLGLDKDYDFKTTKDETDPSVDKGIRHQQFQLHYKNIPVEGVEFTLHSVDGILTLAHGRIPEGLYADISKPMAESKALDFALANIKVTIDDLNKKGRKKPQGELLLARLSDDVVKTNFKLCYAFDIYGNETLNAFKIYVDAATGEVTKKVSLIHNCIKFNAATQPTQPVVASTFQPRFNRYGNSRDFDTEINNGTSFLFWNVTGPRSLETQEDTNGDGNWDNVELTNPSTNWGTNHQNATMAHWITQRTYEYFRDVHSRNGWDGNGLIGRVLVNVDDVNAFWDRTRNLIGIGFGPVGGISGAAPDANRPLTTIDVVAHEWMHGLTGNSANLIYQGESGALNEGLSDIFGTVMERRILGNTNFNWTIGEESWLLRNMAMPNAFGHPDKYQGSNWINPNSYSDAGGVHTNSGVLNKWFHTLCTGQTPYSTYPQAINFDRATQIVFRALRYYLQSTSGYYDMREATLIAAQDLFGSCSNEAQQVINAWAAANVGTRFDLDCYTTTAIATGCYRLKAQHSSKYLQVPNNNVNGQIIQNTASAANNQVFKFEATNYLGSTPCPSCFKVINQENFKFVKFNGSSPSSGSQIIQDFWRIDHANRYGWRVLPMSDGTFQVAASADANYRYDVASNSTANGAGIQLWPNHGGGNQRFYFESAACPTNQNPDCAFAVSATVSNANPQCGASVTLSAACTGNCTDITYTWTGNGLASSSPTVSVTHAQAATFNYTLTAFKNFTTCPGQSISIPVTVYGPCVAGSTCANVGSITYERWNNTGGYNTDIQSLRNATNNLQNIPTVTQNLSLFEAPTDIADQYGARMRGYVCPPTSGNYTFWVAGDDHTELWLSTNDQPFNIQRIAYHTNWTSPREWAKNATQQSVQINLQAGQRYYIEALVKEGGGGDNLAVGWQLPNGTLERPIPSNRMIPFSGGSGCVPPAAPSISANPSNIVTGGNSIISASGCGGTVNWSNGQTGSSISVSPSTTTSYTATCSAGGCTSVSSNTAIVSVTSGGTCPSGNFGGYLDVANCSYIAGWCLDQSNFALTAKVEILVDGQVVATVDANQPRPDLGSAFGTSAAVPHGYTYNIPINATWRSGTRIVRARPCGTSGNLGNSPLLNVSFNNCRIGVLETTSASNINPLLENDLILSPNPTDGLLNVKLWIENKSNVEIGIQDITSRTAKKYAFIDTKGQFDTYLNLSDLPSGIYLLTLQTNQKHFTKKLIILR